LFGTGESFPLKFFGTTKINKITDRTTGSFEVIEQLCFVLRGKRGSSFEFNHDMFGYKQIGTKFFAQRLTFVSYCDLSLRQKWNFVSSQLLFQSFLIDVLREAMTKLVINLKSCGHEIVAFLLQWFGINITILA
jgi:hypothetical protein